MTDLKIERLPEVECPVMVLGFSGWMDGGRVSTATVGYLGERLGAERLGEIDAGDFQIFNFPVATLPITIYVEDGHAIVAPVSPMESAAAFRPHCRIANGRLEKLVLPANRFFASEKHGVALFSGEEPHMRWRSYSDCVFEVAERIGVRQMYFVGSVAGPVPHTREPRIRSSLTNDARREEFEALGIAFTDYEGPSSIVTYLMQHAPDHGIEFANLVAEIPHYPFIEMPTYPRSIVTVVAALRSLLGLDLDMTELMDAADVVERRLNEVMADNEEFSRLATKLEEAYDIEPSEADEALLRNLIDSLDLGGENESDEPAHE
jgi:predicted ATP-grasp superfamily ATP-dependent carboligase